MLHTQRHKLDARGKPSDSSSITNLHQYKDYSVIKSQTWALPNNISGYSSIVLQFREQALALKPVELELVQDSHSLGQNRSIDLSQEYFTIQAVNVATYFVPLFTSFSIFPTCLIDLLFASSLLSPSLWKLGD